MIEWLAAHTPLVLTEGAQVYGADEPVTAPLALLFAPDGDGACIEGTREQLLAMLDGARTALDPSPVTATTLAANLTSTDLYFLSLTLGDLARAATYPALTVTIRDLTDSEDDGTADPYEFHCPHCGEATTAIRSHDVAHRQTESNEITREGKISFSYQRGSDFHPLVYLAVCCDKPVSLPQGWVES